MQALYLAFGHSLWWSRQKQKNPVVLFSSDETDLFTGSYLTYGNVEEGRVEQEV